MHKIYILLITLIISIGATGAYGKTKRLLVNKDRLINITGAINYSIIHSARELVKLTKESKEPIYIHINSPGGIVNAGLLMIDALNIASARRVPTVCITTLLAASMAFNMLPHCDYRFALSNTQLLFHPARLVSSKPLTHTELAYYASELRLVEQYTVPILINMLGIDRPTFMKHYNNETMWSARSLLEVSNNDWLNIVDDIQGLNLFNLQNNSSRGNSNYYDQYNRPIIINIKGGLR